MLPLAGIRVVECVHTVKTLGSAGPAPAGIAGLIVRCSAALPAAPVFPRR